MKEKQNRGQVAMHIGQKTTHAPETKLIKHDQPTEMMVESFFCDYLSGFHFPIVLFSIKSCSVCQDSNRI